MAEAMTVETILEADWQMQGFWTRLRFPIRTQKGGWSDIDLLAYQPEKRHLVVAESKVRGPKRDIFAYTPYSKKKYGSILQYDLHDGQALYFRFLDHLPLAYKDGAVFQNFKSMVRRLTVHLVSNYYIDPRVKADADAAVTAQIAKKVPKGIEVGVKLETTLDVILRILTAEGVATQGRRYGHAVIDLARELNRYMQPNVRFAGRSNDDAEHVRAALSKQIVRAFGKSVSVNVLPNSGMRPKPKKSRAANARR